MMGDGRVNIVPMTTQVGSYIPHACGAAWGAKLKGHDTRFLAIFGDGAILARRVSQRHELRRYPQAAHRVHV